MPDLLRRALTWLRDLPTRLDTWLCDYGNEGE